MLGGRLLIVALALLIVPVGPGVGQASGPVDAFDAAGPVERVDSEVLEPGLLDKLEDGPHGVIVQFDDEVPADLADIPGIQPGYTFESIPAAYVLAEAAGVRTLSHGLDVIYIEDAWKPVAFDLETATLATMAREVWDPLADNPTVDGDPPAIEVDGELVDGSGVGIAIVDTGVDATHPDLMAPDKLVRSFLATPAGVVEAPYHSPLDPHGTGVAGTAAGTGDASGGTLAGAAPGASLYSFAIHHATVEDRTRFGLQGDGLTLSPAIAMDWIAAHGSDQEPPIEVVNNAWHCRAPECRADAGGQAIHAQLAGELVEQGITVTWAFGNNPESWNPEATLPIQGVIGVTSTSEFDAAIRTGCKSDFSSQGHPLEPSTWPVVAAPGAFIESTTPLHLATQTRVPELDAYSIFSGTSLAAAHVAGTAALLLQANPDLSPAEIEWILEETATEPPEEACQTPYHRADPAHPTSLANHQVGHGLIHAYAAVEMAIGFSGIPETDEQPVEPSDAFLEPEHREDLDAVRVQDRFYLTDAGSATTERPTAPESSSIQVDANEPIVFTSEPLADAWDVTGIDASLWIELDTEQLSRHWSFVEPLDLVLRVEQIGPGDVLKDAVTITAPFVDAFTGRVVERPFVQAFDTPMAFDGGDRVRATVTLQSSGVAGSGAPASSLALFFGSAAHPSHVGLGVQAPDAPGTYEGCRSSGSDECAWIDADHPSTLATLDVGTQELSWEGPGGSGAQMVLHGDIVLDGCTIPAEEAWGRCVVRAHSPLAGRLGPTSCEIIDPAAPIEGHGRCVAFRGN